MKPVTLLFGEVLQVMVMPREILQGDTVQGTLHLANLGQEILKDVVIDLRPASWAVEAKLSPARRIGSLAPGSQERLDLSLRTGSSAGTRESLAVKVQCFKGDRRFSPPPQAIELEVLPPSRRAEALEQYARSLGETACSDEALVAAWQAAARAFEAEGERDRVAACRREVARCLRLPIITLDVELGQGLVLDAWSRLRFIVRNEGFGPARNLVVRAEGDGLFEGQVTATRRISTLRAGRERVDWLDVCPHAYGDSVPLRVRAEYQDRTGETRICEHTIHIPVAPIEAVRQGRQTYNVFVSGSGAAAVGDGAVAAGGGSVAVGGDVSGDVTLGAPGARRPAPTGPDAG